MATKKASIKLKAAMLNELDSMLEAAKDRKDGRVKELAEEKEAVKNLKADIEAAERNGEDTWSLKYRLDNTEQRITHLEFCIEAYSRIEETLSELF